MFLHPTLTASIAEQHRRDLMSQASACRQARATRQSRPGNPVRRPLTVKALRAMAAASAIAASAFLVVPAGSSHAPSANGKWSAHFAGHGNWYTSHRGDVHSGILAVHFANGKWCMNHQTVTHHFQATTRWA